MPVFLIQNPIDSEGSFRISKEDLRHLKRVLRVRPGVEFLVRQPDGRKALAILDSKGGIARGKIKSIFSEAPPATMPLWLGVGLVRWPKMEWLVEKLTELGIERLTPLLTAYSKFNSEISASKINRLNKISQETLKQCERSAAVRIDLPQQLKEFLKSGAQASAQKLIFNESLAKRQFPSLKAGGRFIFLIGPEGGFSPAEVELAKSAGFQEVSLGAAKLRTETAALYGACVLDGFLAGQETR